MVAIKGNIAANFNFICVSEKLLFYNNLFVIFFTKPLCVIILSNLMKKIGINSHPSMSVLLRNENFAFLNTSYISWSVSIH